MDVEARGQDRMWSWAASSADVEARRHEATTLVGERIRAVRYFTLDYRREELHPDLIGSGPRLAVAAPEWREPTWAYGGFDAIDYGLELVTESGATFSITWDPPGGREGIGLQPVPMLGSALRRDADVAIWELNEGAATWAPLIGQVITGVALHYLPWDEALGGMWCPHITIDATQGRVEIVLGDAQNGRLVPSADGVAVLHAGTLLPAWV